MLPDHLTVAVRSARKGFITESTLHAEGLCSTPAQEEEDSIPLQPEDLRRQIMRMHTALSDQSAAADFRKATTHDASVFLKQCE